MKLDTLLTCHKSSGNCGEENESFIQSDQIQQVLSPDLIQILPDRVTLEDLRLGRFW